VQELGGQVQVHSTPGQGTEVTLLLPVFELHREAGLPLAEAS
jgi:signal transduction histidine kinase